jgi:hypothetical protein
MQCLYLRHMKGESKRGNYTSMVSCQVTSVNQRITLPSHLKHISVFPSPQFFFAISEPIQYRSTHAAI